MPVIQQERHGEQSEVSLLSGPARSFLGQWAQMNTSMALPTRAIRTGRGEKFDGLDRVNRT
jgi:hypothetical protein